MSDKVHDRLPVGAWYECTRCKWVNPHPCIVGQHWVQPHFKAAKRKRCKRVQLALSDRQELLWAAYLVGGREAVVALNDVR